MTIQACKPQHNQSQIKANINDSKKNKRNNKCSRLEVLLELVNDRLDPFLPHTI